MKHKQRQRQRERQIETERDRQRQIETEKETQREIDRVKNKSIFLHPQAFQQNERFSSASTTTCNSSVFNSTSFLPTVEEEKELRIDPTLNVVNVTNVTNVTNVPAMAETSKMASALNTSYPPPTSNSRSSRLKANEVHPKSMAKAVIDVKSNLYPYHANSSNWNPVSRQDSELQSQSSGAVGEKDEKDERERERNILRNERQILRSV